MDIIVVCYNTLCRNKLHKDKNRLLNAWQVWMCRFTTIDNHEILQVHRMLQNGIKHLLYSFIVGILSVVYWLAKDANVALLICLQWCKYMQLMNLMYCYLCIFYFICMFTKLKGIWQILYFTYAKIICRTSTASII